MRSSLWKMALSLLFCVAGSLTASEPCDEGRQAIERYLRSPQSDERVKGFREVLRCRRNEELPLVAESLNSTESLVGAAAAMTLAMSGKSEYRPILVERYMKCPDEGCPIAQAHLLAAVLVGCSELNVGDDPKSYDIPLPPIEFIADECVDAVRNLLRDGLMESNSERTSSTPDSLSPYAWTLLRNFKYLVVRSGSSRWIPLLASLLGSKNDEIRLEAATTATFMKPKWIGVLALPHLDDPNAEVRKSIISGLSKVQTEDVRAALRKRLDVETDESIIIRLHWALGDLLEAD
jgi:hypothetical protein